MFSGKRTEWIGFLTAVFVGGLICGTIGCGFSEPYKMTPVHGKVTYDDGSLISAKRVVVQFTPQVEAIDPKITALTGLAEVNIDDGTFSVATSHKYGDGLVVGKHVAKVLSYDENGLSSELELIASEIEVGPKSNEFVFLVKKP